MLRRLAVPPPSRLLFTMPPRHFTVPTANATLPFVERVVRDIVADYGRWKDALERYELAAAGATMATGEPADAERLRLEVDDLAARIEGFVAELNHVGCVLKGFEEGLVDFPATLDGREVCLCWRLGEAEVAHWHEVNDGFAGRQSLASATLER